MKNNSNKKAIKRGALALLQEFGKQKKKLRQERGQSDRLDAELDDAKASYKSATRELAEMRQQAKAEKERIGEVQKELKDMLTKVREANPGYTKGRLEKCIEWLDLEDLDKPF